MGIVKAVCVSETKGVQKQDVGTALFEVDNGIANDAHRGKWHRQVSLLSFDKIEEFRKRGAEVDFGAFGENLVVEGFDFRNLPVGTMFRCGEVLLEMTQIGKECHSHCQIYHKMGDCIMPREGVFAQVIQGGRISVGDEMIAIPRDPNAPLRAAIVTLSDKGSEGERVDESGPAVKEILEANGYEVVEMLLLPDVQKRIQIELMRLADGRQVNFDHDNRWHRIFPAGLYAGGDARCCDPQCSRHCRGDPCLFFAVHQSGDAEPCWYR